MDYLEKHADEALPVQEIADALEQESISKSSVYRNLAELEMRVLSTASTAAQAGSFCTSMSARKRVKAASI